MSPVWTMQDARLAALVRELHEELGAEVDFTQQVFVA